MAGPSESDERHRLLCQRFFLVCLTSIGPKRSTRWMPSSEASAVLNRGYDPLGRHHVRGFAGDLADRRVHPASAGDSGSLFFFSFGMVWKRRWRDVSSWSSMVVCYSSFWRWMSSNCIGGKLGQKQRLILYWTRATSMLPCEIIMEGYFLWLKEHLLDLLIGWDPWWLCWWLCWWWWWSWSTKTPSSTPTPH